MCGCGDRSMELGDVVAKCAGAAVGGSKRTVRVIFPDGFSYAEKSRSHDPQFDEQCGQAAEQGAGDRIAWIMKAEVDAR